MTTIAIFGAGQIGRAAFDILNIMKMHAEEQKIFNGKSVYEDMEFFVIDSNVENIKKLTYGNHCCADLEKEADKVVELLKAKDVDYVINAMPFYLNEKIAKMAFEARAGYIDFTEDDQMAESVRKVYEGSMLNCAVKCGLAPGFINYVGHDLIKRIPQPESLMVSVGALPNAVSYDEMTPWDSYALSWSVDGLVNEYIRPCQVRLDGKETEIAPLTGLTKVILDGTEYEAAFTSGGVGSLIKDLPHVPNVYYKTLRYPGHYKWVRSVTDKLQGNFFAIKQEFLSKFATTTDDVIVVYAKATGKDESGKPVVETYWNKFTGTYTLTGIQATTASSGIAVLELMLKGRMQGIIGHSTISILDLESTEVYKMYYRPAK